MDQRDIYQAKMARDIDDAHAAGYRNVLCVLPTGGGKSVIVRRGVQRRSSMGRVQAVLAHRVELTSQMAMHVATEGVFHNVIAPKPVVRAIAQQQREELGRSFVNIDAHVHVGAVDTLLARKDDETIKRICQSVDDWTVDEAHHVLRENKWGACVDMFPRALGVGVTASPRRADGKGLGRHADGVFDHMVLGPTMRELINMGALSEYELVCPTSDLEIDDSDFNAEGELSPRKGRAAAIKSHIVGDVADRYFEYAAGKQAIVFATDVETAHEIATALNNRGVAAMALSGKTDAGVRRDAVRRFKQGTLTVLVNVDLFGEGFDVPACEVVIMARPTGSLAVYLQQFGRALRIVAGKQFGRIIDMVSNYKRHGFPDKQHQWSLDRAEKRGRTKEPDPEDIDLIACKACTRPYAECLPACPWCGQAPEPPAKAARSIDVVRGDLTLLDAATLAQMRAAMTLDDPSTVGGRVAAVAGEYAAKKAIKDTIDRHQAQRSARLAIEQWAGIQKYNLNRSDAEIHRRFYLAMGFDIMTALSGKRQELEKVATTVRGWYE